MTPGQPDPGYTAHDRERWAAEPRKIAGAFEQGGAAGPGSGGRSPFARDRARVLHSSALRRLAGKTQVVGPADDALPRTRLTHSLEVAQLAREIGSALGCDPDVVDAAGLAHDLGHPPFGHNGEAALDEVAAGIGGFEGNAQTLRILTRLEPKAFDAEGASVGLNLTRATLDATAKYPWPRPALAGPGVKFGVYRDDLPAFRWLRAGRDDDRRCLEAQVMDWADDVAYSVHDVEDAVILGLLDTASIGAAERAEISMVAADLYGPFDAGQLSDVLGELLVAPYTAGLARFDGSHRAAAELKSSASELIGRFVGACVRATLSAARVGGAAGASSLAPGAGPALLRYRADLVVPDRIRAECALLKAMAVHFVMRRKGADEIRADERDVLRELVDALARSAPASLEPPIQELYAAAADDAGRLRAVIDQVATLTDSAALSWHRRLTAR